MHKTALFLLLSLVAAKTTAQKKKIIEPAILECHYKLQGLKDTLTGEQMREDYLILRIGQNSSQCYSIYQFFIDSLVSTPDGVRTAGNMTLMSVRKRDHESRPGSRILTEYIYKNYPANKMTLESKAGVMGHYIFEEEYLPQNWTIQDSVKQVGSYECQMATCEFRGRSYCAWFTPEIPISNGPWKFNGLPGLILEVYDQEQHYRYEITSVRSEELEPVTYYNFWTDKPEKTTRIEYLRLCKKSTEQASNFFSSGNMESKPRKEPQRDYMERDYR